MPKPPRTRCGQCHAPRHAGGKQHRKQAEPNQPRPHSLVQSFMPAGSARPRAPASPPRLAAACSGCRGGVAVKKQCEARQSGLGRWPAGGVGARTSSWAGSQTVPRRGCRVGAGGAVGGPRQSEGACPSSPGRWRRPPTQCGAAVARVAPWLTSSKLRRACRLAWPPQPLRSAPRRPAEGPLGERRRRLPTAACGRWSSRPSRHEPPRTAS